LVHVILIDGPPSSAAIEHLGPDHTSINTPEIPNKPLEDDLMKRTLPNSILAPVVLICLSLTTACDTGIPSDSGADLILTNARVYTLAWSEPTREGEAAPDAPFDGERWTPDAEAVALKDGLILAVGSAEEVDAFRGNSTDVRNLDGAVVVPGLIESHGHYEELGELAEEVDLVGVSTEEDLVARVMERAESTVEGEWIVGGGWDEGEWADHLPTNYRLNQLLPKTPVVLKGLRGFGVFGNQAALDAAGIGPDTPSPSGGEILKDENGKLTGVLLNRAVPLLREAIPERSLEQRKRVILHGLNEILEAGYVMGHHAGVFPDYVEAYEALAAEDALPIRMEVMLSTREPGRELLEEWIQRGPTQDPNAFLQVRSVKAYYDASLGSRGAKMIGGYTDLPTETGEAGASYGFIEELVALSIGAGFQAVIHAIGDGGNRDVLDFYERTFQDQPESQDLRHRIEHAQVVHPDDFARFAEMDIVASMQPPHAVEDSPWAEDRLGPERIVGAYAWRTMRRHGVHLLFNSDLSGSDFDIFYGLHSAITRTSKDLQPSGGWYPDQRMTPEEALRGYTVWAAFASSREQLTGTIEVGKWGDLSVLSLDPLNVGTSNPHALLEGEALMAIVAGEIAFERSPEG
jgi:predicted amidohydrolase YtcJ